jgi:hypothetical protein
MERHNRHSMACFLRCRERHAANELLFLNLVCTWQDDLPEKSWTNVQCRLHSMAVCGKARAQNLASSAFQESILGSVCDFSGNIRAMKSDLQNHKVKPV